jgi:hypothetical protein
VCLMTDCELVGNAVIIMMQKRSRGCMSETCIGVDYGESMALSTEE